MFSVFEFLNRILSFVDLYLKKRKEKGVQDAYKNIDEDLEGYVSGDYSDGNSGVFTPSGLPPTSINLSGNSKSE